MGPVFGRAIQSAIESSKRDPGRAAKVVLFVDSKGRAVAAIAARQGRHRKRDAAQDLALGRDQVQIALRAAAGARFDPCLYHGSYHMNTRFTRRLVVVLTLGLAAGTHSMAETSRAMAADTAAAENSAAVRTLDKPAHSLDTGTMFLPENPIWWEHLVFTPDSKYLIAAGPRRATASGISGSTQNPKRETVELAIWDSSTGRLIRNTVAPLVKELTGIELSSDGKTVMGFMNAAMLNPGAIPIAPRLMYWPIDRQAGRIQLDAGKEQCIEGIGFRSDGKKFLTASPDGLREWLFKPTPARSSKTDYVLPPGLQLIGPLRSATMAVPRRRRV